MNTQQTVSSHPTRTQLESLIGSFTAIETALDPDRHFVGVKPKENILSCFFERSVPGRDHLGMNIMLAWSHRRTDGALKAMLEIWSLKSGNGEMKKNKFLFAVECDVNEKRWYVRRSAAMNDVEYRTFCFKVRLDPRLASGSELLRIEAICLIRRIARFYAGLPGSTSEMVSPTERLRGILQS